MPVTQEIQGIHPHSLLTVPQWLVDEIFEILADSLTQEEKDSLYVPLKIINPSFEWWRRWTILESPLIRARLAHLEDEEWEQVIPLIQVAIKNGVNEGRVILSSGNIPRPRVVTRN